VKSWIFCGVDATNGSLTANGSWYTYQNNMVVWQTTWLFGPDKLDTVTQEGASTPWEVMYQRRSTGTMHSAAL
jgi:hypothetical protein